MLKWSQELETFKQKHEEVGTCLSLGAFKQGQGSIWAGLLRKGWREVSDGRMDRSMADRQMIRRQMTDLGS